MSFKPVILIYDLDNKLVDEIAAEIGATGLYTSINTYNEANAMDVIRQYDRGFGFLTNKLSCVITGWNNYKKPRDQFVYRLRALERRSPLRTATPIILITEDHFLDWYPRDLPFPGLGGGILFAASWLFAGLSVIGQPHIMIRFAALNDAREMRRARLYYYLWFTVFYVMAIGVGLLARILLDNPAQFDAELALPSIALELLPPPLVGLVLAGIFAATISTADSLILSCSAALSNDLLGHKLHEGWKIRLSTLGMTTVALCLSITDKQSVFALVILAWAALASAFAPLLIVLCLGGRPGEKLALSMMIAGVLSSASWRWAGLADAVYEGMPGILVGLGVYLLGKHRATAANATSAPTDS